MLIAGLNKTTLLDYPGCVAAAVFVGGCNFRCPFCHNGGLVLDPLAQGVYLEDEILAFLEKRKGVLKGVCITGGEPTLHADLPEFLFRIKGAGYKVKLDTNGYAPDVLEALMDEKLVDYVAMDIKNSLDKYALTVGIYNGENTGAFEADKIRRSVSLLKKSSIMYEFRTTVIKEFHTREDLLKIADWIKGCPGYYLQQYQDNENILCRVNDSCAKDGVSSFHGYSKEEMEEMAGMVRQVPGMTGEVFLRGV